MPFPVGAKPLPPALDGVGEPRERSRGPPSCSTGEQLWGVVFYSQGGQRALAPAPHGVRSPRAPADGKKAVPTTGSGNLRCARGLSRGQMRTPVALTTLASSFRCLLPSLPALTSVAAAAIPALGTLQCCPAALGSEAGEKVKGVFQIQQCGEAPALVAWGTAFGAGVKNEFQGAGLPSPQPSVPRSKAAEFPCPPGTRASPPWQGPDSSGFLWNVSFMQVLCCSFSQRSGHSVFYVLLIVCLSCLIFILNLKKKTQPQTQTSTFSLCMWRKRKKQHRSKSNI